MLFRSPTQEVCLAPLAPTRVTSATSQGSLVDGLFVYSVTVMVESVADTAGYRYYRKGSNGVVVALTPGGTPAAAYEDTSDLVAHGIYEYGYSTYNALGEESTIIMWGDVTTVVNPGQLAPKVIIKNIEPDVTASGPPAGCATIVTSLGFTLGNMQDAEGDTLEYRLYRRTPGIGDDTLVNAWTPGTDNAAVSAAFPEGSYEWCIRCIEADAGILDRTEVDLTQWSAITIMNYQPVPYCTNADGQENWGTKGQPLPEE